MDENNFATYLNYCDHLYSEYMFKLSFPNEHKYLKAVEERNAARVDFPVVTDCPTQFEGLYGKAD